jgi:hypothetical protein
VDETGFYENRASDRPSPLWFGWINQVHRKLSEANNTPIHKIAHSPNERTNITAMHVLLRSGIDLFCRMRPSRRPPKPARSCESGLVLLPPWSRDIARSPGSAWGGSIAGVKLQRSRGRWTRESTSKPNYAIADRFSPTLMKGSRPGGRLRARENKPCGHDGFAQYADSVCPGSLLSSSPVWKGPTPHPQAACHACEL